MRITGTISNISSIEGPAAELVRSGDASALIGTPITANGYSLGICIAAWISGDDVEWEAECDETDWNRFACHGGVRES